MNDRMKTANYKLKLLTMMKINDSPPPQIKLYCTLQTGTRKSSLDYKSKSRGEGGSGGYSIYVHFHLIQRVMSKDSNHERHTPK